MPVFILESVQGSFEQGKIILVVIFAMCDWEVRWLNSGQKSLLTCNPKMWWKEANRAETGRIISKLFYMLLWNVLAQQTLTFLCMDMFNPVILDGCPRCDQTNLLCLLNYNVKSVVKLSALEFDPMKSEVTCVDVL